jgi:hypothetical protein
MAGRAQDRASYALDTRVSLLEGDLDKQDGELCDYRNELKAMRMILVGLLISISTASVLLALNLLLSNVGK